MAIPPKKNSGHLIVVAPQAGDLPENGIGATDTIVLMANPALRKKLSEKSGTCIVDVGEIFRELDLTEVNREAVLFARNWFLQEKLPECLSINGINAGGLFFSDRTYFFIGVLKAIHLAEAVMARWGGWSITLWDDGSYWSSIFRLVAQSKNRPIFCCFAGRRRGSFLSAILNRMKGVTRCLAKAALAFLRSPSPGRLVPGGILYSSAPRLVQRLWDFDRAAASYYLRPEYSIKVAKRIGRKHGNLFHIIPSRPGDPRPLFFAKKKQREMRFVARMDRLFSANPFFCYRGILFWPAIRKDLTRVLSRDIVKWAQWIYSLELLLLRLKPKVVVVDEDVNPFNQILVELARIRGVPSLQIQHGIMGHQNFFVPIRTDKLCVYGETSRRRLLEWGARDSQIFPGGLPFYDSEEIWRRYVKNQEKILRDLGVAGALKVVTLATHPFHSEERPDWIGSQDSPWLLEQMIRTAILAVGGIPNVRLLVKLHPRDTNVKFVQALIGKWGGQKTSVILRQQDITEIVCSSTLVLCGFTTVYFEALLLDRPVMVFDSSEKRELGFLTDDYLDVNNVELSSRRIRELVLDESVRDGRMRRQAVEKKQHIFGENRNAAQNLLEFINELAATKRG